MEELHPMAVHLPITLALIWPVLDAVGWATRRRDVSKAGLGVLMVAVAASLFATATGQAAFDVAIDAGVDATILNSHADDANVMPWALLALLATRIGLGVKLRRKGELAGILLGFCLWPFVISVGNSGGNLVYEHGVGVKTVATSSTSR